MRYVQDIERHTSSFQAAFAGGAAGAITRAIGQPLDVLKIRFQLQLESIKEGSKYTSISQAFSSIVKEEGITTLWSGHIPAQLLSISYGILQFTTFEKLTELCKKSNPNLYIEHMHWFNFANGSTAAMVATIASYPFDTIRTRLIAEQKQEKVYKGFLNAFTVIVKMESTKALFRGLIPTLSQIVPHAGIQFSVYKLLTDNVFNRINLFQRSSVYGTIESSLSANILAGGIAGIAAKTAIYPFDVIKKRLQIQGFQQHRQSFGKQMYCTGLLDCIKLTVTDEGFLALYKGYGPSILKAILVSALHFAVYDEIKYFLLKYNYKNS